MHRYYLSYQMALSFHRGVACLPDSDGPRKHGLLRSAETLIHEFALAIRTSDRKLSAAKFCVALLAARDCEEILRARIEELPAENRFEGELPDLLRQWGVLHQRLEGICLETADQERGQLRMLG